MTEGFHYDLGNDLDCWIISFICFSLDFSQFMKGTPLDLALNLGCDMFSCLCKAICDVIKSSEYNPGGLWTALEPTVFYLS